MDPVLRIGYVPGVAPDRFARRWKGVHRGARLEFVAVASSRQREALDSGEVDMCFVRLPIQEDGLHRVLLWEERPVVVISRDHVLSAVEEVTEDDLAEETEIPARHPDDAADRIATAATGVGFTRVPMSLARLHHDKDRTARPIRDAEPTQIALVWPREDDDDLRQTFVGVVRGRTPRSSR